MSTSNQVVKGQPRGRSIHMAYEPGDHPKGASAAGRVRVRVGLRVGYHDESCCSTTPKRGRGGWVRRHAHRSFAFASTRAVIASQAESERDAIDLCACTRRSGHRRCHEIQRHRRGHAIQTPRDWEREAGGALLVRARGYRVQGSLPVRARSRDLDLDLDLDLD